MTPNEATPDPENLEETVHQIRRYQEHGDVAALDAVFTRYYDRVRRVVRVMMSPSLRRRVDVDDIVNSTFGKAFELFDRFEHREHASVIHWLSAIAHNKIRDRFKTFDRRAELELEALFGVGDRSTPAFTPKADDTLPPERVAKEEMKVRVDECIAALKEDYRNVILLRDFEGGSWRYVGETMGRSENAAHMLYGRAKLALVEIMKRDGLI